jgi:ribosomal protein S6--L-glutamate ligase
MDILLLSRGTYLYSTQRLAGAARRRGHEATILNPFDCWVSLDRGAPTLHHQMGLLALPDVVLPRIGVKVTFYGLSILRQLESLGVFAINGSQAVARSRDKLRAHQILTAEGVPTPKTAFVRHSRYVKDALASVGGPPVIVKVIEGTQGVGVLLAESEKSALSLIETMHVMNQNILLQQFVEEAQGRDIRALVVGDRVVAAMTREAVEGEFRSNIHRGGTGKAIDLDREYEETAVLAVRALGLNFAGVDLIATKEGPKVLEVNSSPGLEGIERVTNVDVAGALMDWVGEHAASGVYIGSS